jgi:hypothetical protein
MITMWATIKNYTAATPVGGVVSKGSEWFTPSSASDETGWSASSPGALLVGGFNSSRLVPVLTRTNTGNRVGNQGKGRRRGTDAGLTFSSTFTPTDCKHLRRKACTEEGWASRRKLVLAATEDPESFRELQRLLRQRRVSTHMAVAELLRDGEGSAQLLAEVASKVVQENVSLSRETQEAHNIVATVVSRSSYLALSKGLDQTAVGVLNSLKGLGLVKAEIVITPSASPASHNNPYYMAGQNNNTSQRSNSLPRNAANLFHRPGRNQCTSNVVNNNLKQHNHNQYTHNDHQEPLGCVSTATQSALHAAMGIAHKVAGTAHTPIRRSTSIGAREDHHDGSSCSPYWDCHGHEQDRHNISSNNFAGKLQNVLKRHRSATDVELEEQDAVLFQQKQGQGQGLIKNASWTAASTDKSTRPPLDLSSLEEPLSTDNMHLCDIMERSLVSGQVPSGGWQGWPSGDVDEDTDDEGENLLVGFPSTRSSASVGRSRSTTNNRRSTSSSANLAYANAVA